MDGETYLDCWEGEEIKLDTAYGVKVDGLQVRPIYQEVDDGEFELKGYELV